MTTNHPKCPQCRDTLSASAVFTEDGTILTRSFCDGCGYATPIVSYGPHEIHQGTKPPTGAVWHAPRDDRMPLLYWGAS